MVAYDGSEASQEAIVVAKDMAGDDSEATIHVVSVIPVGLHSVGIDSPITPVVGMTQGFSDIEAYEAMMEETKVQTMQSMVEQLGNTFDDVACEVTVNAVPAAKASTGICDYAKDHEIDMIIMGRRGLGALRAMLGSVSYAVLHETDIPVVTVK